MFVSNYEFFETENKIMDKFGINLQDSVNLMVSKKRFSEEAAKYGTDTTPQEGDLIYFPEYGGIYEIKYVGTRNSFFAYEFSCELFRYSGEQIDTEIKEVDDIESNVVIPIRQFTLTDTDNLFFEGETIYQGTNLASSTYSAVIVNYDIPTNTLDVHTEVGTATSLLPLKGNTSLASVFYVSIVDTEKKFLETKADDTNEIELERAKNDIVDFTDKDPFSVGNW
jgi:hypothetical protein